MGASADRCGQSAVTGSIWMHPGPAEIPAVSTTLTPAPFPKTDTLLTSLPPAKNTIRVENGGSSYSLCCAAWTVEACATPGTTGTIKPAAMATSRLLLGTFIGPSRLTASAPRSRADHATARWSVSTMTHRAVFGRRGGPNRSEYQPSGW